MWRVHGHAFFVLIVVICSARFIVGLNVDTRCLESFRKEEITSLLGSTHSSSCERQCKAICYYNKIFLLFINVTGSKS